MSLSHVSGKVLDAVAILAALLLAFGGVIVVMWLVLWITYDVPLAP